MMPEQVIRRKYLRQCCYTVKNTLTKRHLRNNKTKTVKTSINVHDFLYVRLFDMLMKLIYQLIDQ